MTSLKRFVRDLRLLAAAKVPLVGYPDASVAAEGEAMELLGRALKEFEKAQAACSDDGVVVGVPMPPALDSLGALQLDLRILNRRTVSVDGLSLEALISMKAGFPLLGEAERLLRVALEARD